MEAMATIHLHGRITEKGELDRALGTIPLTGSEIVQAGLTGGWAERGITDGEGWVRERRHRRQEERTKRHFR